MTYPRRETNDPNSMGDTPDAVRARSVSPGTDDVGSQQGASRQGGQTGPVEIHIVHDRPQEPDPQPDRGEGHTGARWFWRIVALAVLVIVVVLGFGIMGDLHQVVLGQAAQTAAINRQTGVLQGIGRQLSAIATALNSLVAVVNRAFGALSHLGG